MKSIRDIRTRSGRSDRFANAYLAYMQITCLEMEKARKGRERVSTSQRLQLLDARLLQIEIEKGQLLEDLARRKVLEPGDAPTALAPKRRGINVRY
jgi:hypothetical protein